MSNLGSGSMDVCFKQAAKSYIEQESLDDEQLAKFELLLAGHLEEQSTGNLEQTGALRAGHHSSKPAYISEQLQEYGSTRSHLKANRGKYSLLALTASLVLVFMLSVNFYPGSRYISWKIADEVAMNHIKMKPMELKSDRLAPLRDYFTQLDFSVVRSELFAKKNYTMLGGRYCSIQGVTAAQIRYRTDKGQKVTLYEVAYDPKLYGDIPKIEQGEAPLSIDVKGVSVSLWVEKGLLMAEAKNLD